MDKSAQNQMHQFVTDGAQDQGQQQNTPRPKLSLATLGSLPEHVKGPNYDPTKVTPGHLHIGAGNFALAHIASYTDKILSQDNSWGIIAASIRSDGTISGLRKQDNLYVLIEREGTKRRPSVMAPIVGTLFGKEDPNQIVATVADSRIRLVTFTVTNKGYYVVGRENRLDLSHPDVFHDLNLPSGQSPRTLYWYMANGLEQRRKANGGPITMLSLDNIPQNSKTLKSGLVQFVQELDMTELATWIEDNVDFPVSTVDRITPETTADFRKEAAEYLGFESCVVIGTEYFHQLVLEHGKFALPPWETAGARLVEDCTPFWELKFFCLNGAHQVPAILGQRMGFKYIHEATQNAGIWALLERIHGEYASVMPMDSTTVGYYAGQIRSRFADSALGDTVERVGARATSKVSERLLVAVERGLAANGKVLFAPTFVAACWLLNLGGEDEFGQSIALNDADAPKLEALHEEVLSWVRSIATVPQKPEELEVGTLATILANVGGAVQDNRFVRLAGVSEFVQALAWALAHIHHLGTEQAINALLQRQA